MTTKGPTLKKTNRIFSALCAALGLGTEEKIQWMADAGYPVSKSKIVNWGSRGKNYVNMPDEALDAFLVIVQARSTSPTLILLACGIANASGYDGVGLEIDALSELVTLMQREYGYTPANLRHECTKAGGRAEFAALHGIPEATLDKWCRQVDDEANHHDMPLKKWLDVTNTGLHRPE